MGTIRKRKRKDGSAAFLAQIVIKRDGRIIHREAKTHDQRIDAAVWMVNREKELKTNPPKSDADNDPFFCDLIDRFIKESRKDMGRTKTQVLQTIQASSLGETRASEITSQVLFNYIQELGKDKQPQTVLNYMSHISNLFAIARPAWGVPLDKAAFDDAMVIAKRMGAVSKSKSRSRRPTLEELDKILTFFEERQVRYPNSAPMAKIIVFALFSTRRQEEIIRIQWADLEDDGSRILVRDMKHPGQKIGNDQWCDLVPEALAVIGAMPKTDSPRIFPYTTDAVSAAFTRACKVLEIEDLHFHDLRHEGISRLAELGWSIPHIAGVSGHRSWQSLNRYSHMRKKGDKYEGWEWLERLGLALSR